MSGIPGEEEWPVVYAYSRAQALADGVLVDVSETARQTGFGYPVAVTERVWDAINDIPANLAGVQDVAGRLWDVLWIAYIATLMLGEANSTELHYRLKMPCGSGPSPIYELKLVCGPGDNGESVITIMEPDED